MYSDSLASTFSQFTPSKRIAASVYLGLTDSALWHLRSQDPESKTPPEVQLCTKLGPYQVTPLTIGVMLDRAELVLEMLNVSTDSLNAQDIKGNTALHHAALKADRALMDLLISRGADTTIRNAQGGVAEELYNLCHPRDNSALRVVCEEEVIDAKKFKELTGANLIDEYIIPAELMIKQWTELTARTLNSISLTHLTDASYEAFRALPSGVGFKKTDPIGFSAVALRDFEPGDIVSEYLGEETALTESKDPYFFYPYISSKHRNVSSFIQDGAPNMGVCSLSNVRGVAQRILFIALTKIPKGTLPLFDYGVGHSVKGGGYIELNPSATREFIESGRFAQVLMSSSLPRVGMANLPYIYDWAMLSYIGNTLGVIVNLLIEKKITLKELSLLKSRSQFVSAPLAIKWPFLMKVFKVLEEASTKRDFSFINHLKKAMSTEKADVCLNFIFNYPNIKNTLAPANSEISDFAWKAYAAMVREKSEEASRQSEE